MSPNRIRVRLPLLLLALALPACGQRAHEDEGQTPPPAAALSPAGTGLTLDQKLSALDDDLGRVLDSGLDDNARDLIYRAEAMTDRLLEERPPVAWLATGYDVEARLRQIQALADRIVAEMRRDVAEELVLQDVAALRYSVHELRGAIAQGGREAPPSLDSLLAGVPEGAEPGPTTGGGTASSDSGSRGGGARRPQPPGLLGTPVE